MDILQAERSYRTPVSNSTLLPLLLLSLATQKNAPKTSTTFKEEYDYIVVGAGPAGSVVSSRLSELPCVNVLLLEAGHKPPILTDVPAFLGSFIGSDIDWKYKTVPQRYAGYGQKNRQISLPAGKVLGGSSNINGMIYVRGNRKNYDSWEDQGAEGWSYKDIFRYFLKLEDNRNPQYVANGFHATSGPITVELPRYSSELKRAVFDAASSLGYQFVDSNSERQSGFYDQQLNNRNNQRCSAVKGYLVPAENRKNLDILTDAMVTKIIVENGRAIGVEFFSRGQTFVVRARREVIISAGTYNTPKLLMLSGIGPREELQKFGIPVIADLPVGKNLQDHPMVLLPFTVNPRLTKYVEKISDPSNILQYIFKRSGPLASVVGVIYTSFLEGLNIYSANDSPRQQVYFREISEAGESFEPGVYERYFKPYENKTSYSCLMNILGPRSRGSVTLKSRNPFDPPLINPNYFEDPRDLEDAVTGLKICKRIIDTPQMRNGLGAKLYETLLPGCEMFSWSNDEYLKCYTRTLTSSLYHTVGTCKMGKASDTSTVLDPKLRVKNMQGLRVVDASVMPTVTWGNTQIPTLMISEKASDMIKETINCP